MNNRSNRVNRTPLAVLVDAYGDALGTELYRQRVADRARLNGRNRAPAPDYSHMMHPSPAVRQHVL